MDGGDQTFWYLTRASGLVAYLLLFGSVSLGLALTGGSAGLRRYDIYDLHRFIALVTLAVTGFHLLIVLPDAYISFTLPELLVPFASPYRPVYMALGVLGFYLMVLVLASFYRMPRVPYWLWRRLHYATFFIFALALAHGLGAGTDTGTGWALALYGATGWVVLALACRRALVGRSRGLIPVPHAGTEGPTIAEPVGSRPVDLA